MSRVVRSFDRTMTFLVGLAVFALGLFMFVWSSRGVGWLPEPGFVRGLPDSVHVQLVGPGAVWWPWAWLIGGIVLVLLGLRWLVAHLSLRRVGFLTLPGSSEQGRLLVDARSVVDAAALEFNLRPGVETAVGSLDTIEGRLVARISATLGPDAELAGACLDADDISGRLREVLGRDDLAMTVLLRSVQVRTVRVE